MKTCYVPQCERQHESKGLCKSHAQRARSGKSLFCECGRPIPLSRGSHASQCQACQNNKTCVVKGCPRKLFQKGYCPSHYMRWYRGTLFEPTCVVCGEPMESHRMKYCNEHRLRARRSASATSEHRRRSAVHKPYSRVDVFDLDDGVCYLCQSVVEYVHGHLDHIWPLSRGGHDTVYNVAIVHSRCNQIKNATPVENLAQKFPNIKLPERFNHEHYEHTTS